jgi:hypothetical protein
MDVTTQEALRIVSNLPDGKWDRRKKYWIKVIKDEIYGLRVARLNTKADLLEKQLNASIVSSSKIQ